ncbi:flavin monoamine oxidase family protein [Burkholderia ambifaria]|uniref:flavin monoamine oxidase family protein n=1 Tax=Burkholderia ambifaria TaxID=152480 RepID=UPI001B90CD6C|nr:FAD-dependent oxidoreductase [Burkholderia ambifaria]MBR8222349.1 FAD-dependent oxidoreductase [Burkholderia ambifaria]
MQTARIAIIGAGLSGLYAAWLLERQGIRDYVLLEARDTLGGRIVSVAGPGQASPDAGFTADAIDRFDLGPTWFWPEYQHELRRLVDALGLEQFEQFETGDMMVERSPDEPPVRMRGYVNSPASMRVIGGMSSLVDRLRRALDPQRVITGQSVNRMRIVDGDVELDSEDASGGFTTWRVTQVLLALPPRLAENTIAFEPELPPMLARQWRATATWMAPHAKYIAIYDTPFWRDQGLSGEARSARGPLGEIHDASMPGGSAALFGFFGVPAQVRQNVSDEVLCMHSRAQFVRLFGPAAATPRAEFIKDWAQEPYTATSADLVAANAHATAPVATVSSGPWSGRLTGIASEWSPHFPGYLAGAVEAAGLGVQALVSGIATANTSLTTASH